METMNDKTKRPVRFYGTCGQLYNSAVGILRQIPVATGEPIANQPSALACLILAAASIEGFLNELGAIVVDDPEGAPWRPKELTTYGQLWRVAEDCRGPTRYKYELVCSALNAGHEKGHEPFQSFSDLMAVRDRLMHPKAGSGMLDLDTLDTTDDDRLARALEGRGILEKAGKKMNTHWVGLIQTQAAALWACTTASKVVQDLIASVSDWPASEDSKNVSWKEVELEPVRKAFKAPELNVS